MRSLYHGLQIAQLFVFGILGIAAVEQWRRRRNETTAWLAITFGTLAVIAIVGHYLPQHSTSNAVLWTQRIEIAILVLFPYTLYRFVGSLVGRPIRWVFVLGTALTAALFAGAFALPMLPQPGEPRTTYFQLYLVVLLVQWVFLSVIVATRLWRGGKGQPTVAKRRMRTMSLGAIGLALDLVLAGTSNTARVSVSQVIISLLGLASGPLFLLGFAPPRFVRNLWRRPEEAKFRDAELGLMESVEQSEIANALLPHVSQLMSGQGSALIARDGTVIGFHGLSEQEAARVGALLVAGQSTDEDDTRQPTIDVPMRAGWLFVKASSFTPFFGRDETELLQELALLADLALGRAALIARERRLQEQLLEAQEIAHIGSWEWDQETQRATWSKELYRIYGVVPGEIDPVPTTLRDRVHPEDRELVDMHVQRSIDDPKPFEYEYRILRPNGDVRYVQATGKAVLDASGKPAKMVGTVQDITERKKQENLRDQFIANAAHELRTPLTSLLGLTSMLAKHRDSMADDRISVAYDALGRSGDRLAALVNNLLDLTKLQQGVVVMNMQPVSIFKVAREVVEATPPPEGVTVDTNVSQDAVALTDPDRLDQIMSNLLTNAYRYGGEEVVLEASESNGHVVLSVSDNGPGVDADLVPRMFDPFARGAASSSKGGSGLGLAIVKMLVEAADGEIWYENSGGARFCIRFAKVA